MLSQKQCKAKEWNKLERKQPRIKTYKKLEERDWISRFKKS